MIRKFGGWVVLVLGLSPLGAPSQDVLAEKQEVPAECAGKLLFVGAEVQPGEPKPQGQELEKAIEQGKYHRAERFTLVTEMGEGESAAPGKIVTFPDNPKKKYRPINPDETLDPNKIRLARTELLCRRLEVGQAVQRGQVVALFDSKDAADDLVIQVTKFIGAEADRMASEKTRDQTRKRLDKLEAIPETQPKTAALRKAECQVRSSLTLLGQHEVRAGQAGVVTALHKKRGDIVKALEPVLQIQNLEQQCIVDRAQQGLLVQDFPIRLPWTQDPPVLMRACVPVTTKCDGKLLFIGVEVQPGEPHPHGWRLKKAIEQGDYFRAERFNLVTEPSEGETVPAEKVMTFPDNPKKKYRPIAPKETLDPNRVRIARTEVLLRKLEVGHLVQSGQVLAVMDSALAADELAIQAVRFAGAELERQHAEQTRDQNLKRYDSLIRNCGALRFLPNAERLKVYREAELNWMYYIHEEKLKAAVVWEEGLELRACLNRLRQHEVCAGLTGLVTELFKRPGEAIKAGEPILRIQSPAR